MLLFQLRLAPEPATQLHIDTFERLTGLGHYFSFDLEGGWHGEFFMVMVVIGSFLALAYLIINTL